MGVISAGSTLSLAWFPPSNTNGTIGSSNYTLSLNRERFFLSMCTQHPQEWESWYVCQGQAVHSCISSISNFRWEGQCTFRPTTHPSQHICMLVAEDKCSHQAVYFLRFLKLLPQDLRIPGSQDPRVSGQREHSSRNPEPWTVWMVPILQSGQEEGCTVKTEHFVIVSACPSGFQSQDWW